MSTQQQQQGKGQKGSGQGRGRGGGKGRGRGRNQGRGSGNQGQTSKIAETKDVIHKKSSSLENNSEPLLGWYQTTLENLGHFDPSSVARAIETCEEGNVADEQFVSLTMWLEDRLIRSWSLEQRAQLRGDFWNHIDGYLDALECPKVYFENAELKKDGSEKVASWRSSASHRIRVVHWMLACGTSEIFGDTDGGDAPASEETQSPSSIKQPVVRVSPPPAKTTSSTQTPTGSTRVSPENFPLGFSTGDAEVDRILTTLRMKLLIQLENDQKKVNSTISQIQAVTAEKAKPLKQAKMRKHNVNPPPDSSKTSKKSRGKQQRKNR